MKVAISSTADTVEASVDNRFGRCAYFVVFDTENHQVEFIKNTAVDLSQGAGPAAVRLLADHQVSKVISGEFGVKVKPLLEALSIEMQSVKGDGLSVVEVLKQLK